MAELNSLREELDGLETWLAEVDAFLKAESSVPPIGDLETLQAQLEQSNVSLYFEYFT